MLKALEKIIIIYFLQLWECLIVIIIKTWAHLILIRKKCLYNKKGITMRRIVVFCFFYLLVLVVSTGAWAQGGNCFPLFCDLHPYDSLPCYNIDSVRVDTCHGS